MQQRYYLSKGIIGNNVIINGKNFYDQVIDSDVKRYEKNRKLTTGQDDDYTLLNVYRLQLYQKSLQINNCWFK